MNVKMILFDLDGTLLSMDQDVFIKTYFGSLLNKLAPHGYEPKLLEKAIWQGMGAMITNDGSRINEATFWDCASETLGRKILDDAPIFEEYYEKDFDSVQKICDTGSEARDTVLTLKGMGYRVALATNPVFPSIATQKRVSWTGLDVSDFELYTTYENSHYCKPNLNYYKEVIGKLGVSAEECLMVGNDVDDDMVAEKLGMKVFLVTHHLINKSGKDISQYPHGDFADLLEYIKGK